MNKRFVCGAAAMLMTGLSVSLVTTAEPRDRDTAARVAAPQLKAASYLEPGNSVNTPVSGSPSDGKSTHRS
jgi:hypothetical protein